MSIWTGKRIVLGVTGSIAAYKSVGLASGLTKSGALVDVILTEAAAKLVAPLSFSSVTGRRAYLDQDLWQVDDHVLHIELGEKNQALIIAPATANTIAKLAHGLADNLLTLTALASRSGFILAPAMDGGMYTNPATQRNLEILKDRGLEVWGPAEGHLASGLAGKGRMLETEQLMGHLRSWLGRAGGLSGKKVVITAGGTQEPIDPVRILSNRSSGKQGYALAQAALDQGAEVVLVSAPTSLTPPIGADLIVVQTADQMAQATIREIEKADLLIMAAAVADYRPAQIMDQKIKKDLGGMKSIELEETTDILREIALLKKQRISRPLLTVGFAAETDNLVANARKKLQEKDLDLIIANDVSRPDSGIGVDQNQVTLIWKDGRTKDYPLQDKSILSENLIEECLKLM